MIKIKYIQGILDKLLYPNASYLQLRRLSNLREKHCLKTSVRNVRSRIIHVNRKLVTEKSCRNYP